VLYCEDDGRAPLLDWLDGLPDKARDKCVARIERMRELGHELRRPEADYLRDGIYELRASLLGVNYRVLYFFHGREAVVLSHGLVKERVVPPKGIERALARKQKFEADPQKHTYGEFEP
jgi:phage-related protein